MTYEPDNHYTSDFAQHMRNLSGKEVELATMCGTLRGTIIEVFMDHLLLQTRRGSYHVRFEAICWAKEY